VSTIKTPPSGNREALTTSSKQPDIVSAIRPAIQLPQVARAAERDRMARYLLNLPPRLEDLEVRP
jgi:hypothetical protein